jgi:hypothetical protein
MRVAIVKSDGYLDSRISRILANNSIDGDIITKVVRSTFNEYDAIIFTYQNNVPNLPKVIEQIVLEKRVQVLYITNTLSVGQFYNLFEDLFFDYIKEENIDSLIPRLLQSSRKFIKRIQLLETDNRDLTEELLLIKNTNKAKRILMKKGFNEEDAHRFIIDKSMSMRLSKKLVVNLIIENKIDF